MTQEIPDREPFHRHTTDAFDSAYPEEPVFDFAAVSSYDVGQDGYESIDTSTVGADVSRQSVTPETHGRRTAEYVNPFLELDRRVRAATNPFRPAEDVETSDLAAYYGQKPSPNRGWLAWHTTEHAVAIADTDVLATAATAVTAFCHARAPLTAGSDQAEPQFATDRDAVAWHDAALLGAVLPAFADRINHGEVQPDTAFQVYRAIAQDVLPNATGTADRIVTVTCALAARATALSGDSNQFLYPGSPRERENSLHSATHRLYNHHLYALVDETKDPVIVRLQAGTRGRTVARYDEGITTVRFVEDIGSAVAEVDFSAHTREVRRQTAPELIRIIGRIMRREITTGMRCRELDAAAAALQSKIVERRQHKITDPLRHSEHLRARQARN